VAAQAPGSLTIAGLTLRRRWRLPASRELPQRRHGTPSLGWSETPLLLLPHFQEGTRGRRQFPGEPPLALAVPAPTGRTVKRSRDKGFFPSDVRERNRLPGRHQASASTSSVKGVSPNGVGSALKLGPAAAPPTASWEEGASSSTTAAPSSYERTRQRPRARTSAPRGSSARVDRYSASPSGKRRTRIGVPGIPPAYARRSEKGRRRHERLFRTDGLNVHRRR